MNLNLGHTFRWSFHTVKHSFLSVGWPMVLFEVLFKQITTVINLRLIFEYHELVPLQPIYLLSKQIRSIATLKSVSITQLYSRLKL